MTPRTASQECGVGIRAVPSREALDLADVPRPAGRPVYGAAPLIHERGLWQTPFTAELVDLERGPTLVLRGELDLSTRSWIEPVLAEAESAGTPVRVVDLQRLDFLDCGGLDGLLAAARRRAGDHRLTAVIGAGHGRRLFELLDMTADLEVVDLGREAPGRP